MWGIAQHRVNEQQTWLVFGVLGGLYLGYKLLPAMYKEMKITCALDAQRLHRPKSTLPILGNTLDVMFFQKNRLQDWMAEQSQISKGRPWVLRIIGRPQTLIITSPEACEDVFKTQFNVFGRGDDLVDLQHDIFGEGVAGVDGEKWIKQRRIASRMFSMKMLRDVMEDVIIEKSVRFRDVLAQCAKDRRIVPMRSLLGKFSSDVFTKVGFGVDLHGLDGDLNSEMDHPFIQAVDGYAEVFGARLQSPMWYWKLKRFLNVGDERMLKRCIKVATELLNEVVHESIKSKTVDDWKTKTDLLTLFIDSTGKTDSSDIRDAMMNFFLAGKETTSFSLAWVIVNLNRHPRVLAKLRQEIREKLPKLMTGEMQAPTMEDLSKVPYIEAVLKESLRLFMTGVHRAPSRSTTLREGTFVPLGAYVVVSVYAAARMTNVWGEDAAEYNPDRWLDEETGKMKFVNPFQFVTFGGGPHQCVGMRFALLEMQTVIAVLFSRFDIKTIEDPFKITYDYSVTLPVKGPLECTIHEAGAPAF
ncbi:Cytochrome P450 [Plasmopara halstedii]|uniref:Cytochrome P450 n=1 Tax=Plasmopara halstedii TaxID=4781 RepID=A0A0P1AKS7_PLAHL|nr:Cytochrome P450 [Plasmopara halstedii]CEG42001.1 Cytochrome P450 [Plasmopara halstedii]|eukprot:XP_024578370.1 Cytochrome P450 [Plasmopara halstedii]